ncbi:hypothetical protein UT300012_37900 [Paraclostridium bifermentans]
MLTSPAPTANINGTIIKLPITIAILLLLPCFLSYITSILLTYLNLKHFLNILNVYCWLATSNSLLTRPAPTASTNGTIIKTPIIVMYNSSFVLFVNSIIHLHP